MRKLITHSILASTMLAVTLGLTSVTVRAEEPLSIAMTTWSGYGLLHLADKKGFFEEHGVSVNIRTIEDKAATASAIATNRIDGWSTTVDTFMFYDVAKIGAKQVLAVDFSQGGDGVVADKSIESVEDLAGRTVGGDPGSSAFFFLLNVLSDAGLGRNDIELKDMTAGDAGSAFMAGRLDAAATWEPWLGRARERDDAHVLIDTAKRPGLIVDTVAFRQEVIDDRPEAVSGVVAGYFDAYDFWRENTEDANRIMASSLGIEYDAFVDSLDGLTYVSREQNAEYFGIGVEGGGNIATTIEQGGRVYREAGMIDREPDVDEVVDRNFLKTYFDNH